MNQNKRSQKRYPVPDGFYLHLRLRSDMIGRILDISEGGVGFEYVQLWDTDTIPVNKEPLVINILNSGSQLLKNASCKVTYCNGIVTHSLFSGMVPMFRCGLQFVELTQGQRMQLDAILYSCKTQSRRRSALAYEPANSSGYTE
jgi:c-di-GMP-binding flagellar brake protein YcgR